MKNFIQIGEAGMNHHFAKSALLPSGWASNVQITVEQGKIARIETAVPPEQATGERHDVLVPTMPNLHSHAFQRAMPGLTEMRGSGDDSFWSWRTLMYRFALSMTPDQMEAIAAQLYMEMLEAGFGRVGEFHYLHHDRDGHAYANIAEMAERIASASNDTGIALTLLPVFYAHSGFGGLPPSRDQRRFINSIDSFASVVECSAQALALLPDGRIGIAPHSLRAAAVDEIKEILPLVPNGPVHIHVAEQVKEVGDCIAFTGTRPILHLLSNFEVNSDWCLIHATHMTEAETVAMATSGAVAGLCPVTEANLGDGIFPATPFLEQGGAFGIGSDSNVLIGVGEELRQLEYSQRLERRARNVIARPNGSTGLSLYAGAHAGGNQALGVTGGIAKDKAADFVSYDLRVIPWLSADKVLDHIIFAGAPRPDSVWINGVKRVTDGRHNDRERIEERFRRVMTELVDN
jgi:formiminoglutamate deiminase